MLASVSSGQPWTRSSALGDEAIVRRVAETPEGGRKNVNKVVLAAAASAATVDSSDIWSRSSRGRPPEMSTSILSPPNRASVVST